MAKPALDTYGGRLRSVGYEGGITNLDPVTIINKINENALAIGFGRAVARGTADNEVIAPTADGDVIIGISVRHATAPADLAGNVDYAQSAAVPILKQGYIYAIAQETTNQGDGVISITAGNGTLGSTTGGAAGAGRVAVPNAIWETDTAVGEVGVIRIYG